VSYKDRTAIVTCDSKTDMNALTTATTKAGYSSTSKR
jgi:hypothetical protein